MVQIAVENIQREKMVDRHRAQLLRERRLLLVRWMMDDGWRMDTAADIILTTSRWEKQRASYRENIELRSLSLTELGRLESSVLPRSRVESGLQRYPNQLFYNWRMKINNSNCWLDRSQTVIHLAFTRHSWRPDILMIRNIELLWMLPLLERKLKKTFEDLQEWKNKIKHFYILQNQIPLHLFHSLDLREVCRQHSSSPELRGVERE